MTAKLDKLANELFQKFSRTEYALKASGFNNGNGEAKANWRKFAEAVGDAAETSSNPDLSGAVDFMIKYPPKKQVIIDGFINWKSSEPPTDLLADKLLLYVRRVRNNLFHGGKFNGHWFEPERSELLLRHSLVILHHFVEVVPDVKKAYDDSA